VEHLVEAAGVEVPVGAERDFVLLDGKQAQTLRAWCGTLIPREGERPGADEAGAAEYVDATCAGARALVPALLEGLRQLDEIAGVRAGLPFHACPPAERASVLGELEHARANVFAMVRDFTYEAYYAHPQVLAVLERATGWRGTAPATGTPMAAFEERRLARVRQLSPLYRSPE
jgi:Gluconate 2-dehydrogenase subunit 3